MSEHIHMFVSLDHLTVPAQFVGIIRKTIMLKIQELFPILKEALGKNYSIGVFILELLEM